VRVLERVFILCILGEVGGFARVLVWGGGGDVQNHSERGGGEEGKSLFSFRESGPDRLTHLGSLV